VVGSLSYPKTQAQWFSRHLRGSGIRLFGNAGRDLIRGPGMHE
jgi:hypothetical protein